MKPMRAQRMHPGLALAVALWVCQLAACADEPSAGADAGARRVEEARFVTLGGLEQWITIRGDDDRNPILLLVHGGPGDVQSVFVQTYAPYERDFVLVQWDQRGAGKTFGRYGDATPELNLERVTRDGIELTEYLHDRFADNEILLLGHSWGTAITTEMALARPALFAAYVGTGQIASWAELVLWQFDFLQAKAREAGNGELSAELEAIGQPDAANAEQYFSFTRSIRNDFGSADTAWLGSLLDRTRALVSAEELEALGNGMRFSGQSLIGTIMEEKLSTTALRFDIPYYVIQGRDDVSTPTAPAEAYFEKVVAPKKAMVVIEGAGHFALATHAEEFIRALRRMTQ